MQQRSNLSFPYCLKPVASVLSSFALIGLTWQTNYYYQWSKEPWGTIPSMSLMQNSLKLGEWLECWNWPANNKHFKQSVFIFSRLIVHRNEANFRPLRSRSQTCLASKKKYTFNILLPLSNHCLLILLQTDKLWKALMFVLLGSTKYYSALTGISDLMLHISRTYMWRSCWRPHHHLHT